MAPAGDRAGAVQRGEVRPRRTRKGMERGGAAARSGRRRGHRGGGPAPDLRAGIHRVQWTHGQAGHWHRTVPEPGDMPETGAHYHGGVRAGEGDQGDRWISAALPGGRMRRLAPENPCKYRALLLVG